MRRGQLREPADSPSQPKEVESMRYEYVRSRDKAQTC